MSQNELQCFTCAHFIKNSSCGACIENSKKKIQNIDNLLNEDSEGSQKNDYVLKSSCKIVQKYPKESDNLNPSKCKYYMPSFYKLY